MNLASQICFWVPFVGIEIILVLFLYYWIFKRENYKKRFKLLLISEVILVIFSWASQIILSYLYLKNSSELGKYLVSGNNSYFFNQAIFISKDYLWAFVIAVILYFVALIILRYQKRPILDETAPGIIFISILALSSIRLLNFIPGIILAFLLAIIWQIVLIIMGRKTVQERLAISPFLLVSAIIIQLASLTSFYSKTLIFLHLI